MESMIMVSERELNGGVEKEVSVRVPVSPPPTMFPTPKRDLGASLSHREFPRLKLWAHRTDSWPGGQGAWKQR